jgi:hypothetical protein
MTRTLKRINHNVKHIPTSLLYEIRENQYRSRCANYDYCPHAIDMEIMNRASELILDPDQLILKDFKRLLESQGINPQSKLGKLWIADLFDEAEKKCII